jgi:hypothetical protein
MVDNGEPSEVHPNQAIAIGIQRANVGRKARLEWVSVPRAVLDRAKAPA